MLAVIYKRLYLLIFILLLSNHLFSQEDDWKTFQTIKIYPDSIYDIAFDKGILALNFYNRIVQIYILSGDGFLKENFYEIKKVYDDFGTLHFKDDFLYVAIDGFKFYKIDLESKAITKTNTYDEGFYIISRYYLGLNTENWKFEVLEHGDLKISKKINNEKQTSP